jgi:hypothetical protein
LELLYFSSHPIALLLSLFDRVTNTNSEMIIMPSSGSKPTVILGALLPLTGISSSLVNLRAAALQIGVNDVNNYFSKTNSKTRVELIIENTETIR